MKKIILVLFATSLSLSQTNNSMLEYFPMHIGDQWTYEVIEYDYYNDDTLSISYQTYEIVGDSVLDDGYKYFTFLYNKEYGHKIYYRIDSTELTVCSNYYCEYKLDVPQDSVWIDGFGVENYVEYDSSTVGNLDIEAKQIIFKQGFAYFNRTLSKGFGLSYSEEGDLGYHIRKYLVFAKIDGKEYGNPVSVEEREGELISGYSLSQNYPNPFNPTTRITYQIPTRGKVEIKIYDVLGRELLTFINEEQEIGIHEVIFNGIGFANGVYIYTMKSGKYSSSKKLVLIK